MLVLRMSKKELDTRIREKAPVTKQHIKRGLTSVGLEKGDVALVHSSLSAFNYVAGGADSIIDALLETVGNKGTIVMPAFTWGPFHDKEKVVFDIANTPVKSEVGVIPETFRNRKEAVRSRHVCHSVAAIGPHSQDVMGDGVRSFGKDSTFHRLYELDAWNLFLGVGFSCCTELHAVEEYMHVPYRAYRDFRGSKVILPDGSETACKSVELLPQQGYWNDFEKMGEIFSREGILKFCKVGQAKIINVKIRDVFDVTKRYVDEDIGFLLTSRSRSLLYTSLAEGGAWQ